MWIKSATYDNLLDKLEYLERENKYLCGRVNNLEAAITKLIEFNSEEEKQFNKEQVFCCNCNWYYKSNYNLYGKTPIACDMCKSPFNKIPHMNYCHKYFLYNKRPKDLNANNDCK